MGLIDRIMSGAFGYAQNTAINNPLATVRLVMRLVETYPGGVQQLLDKLRASGLGEEVDSWLGHGANLPVTGDQIIAALGRTQVQEVAQHFGMDQQQAATSIAELLPEVVDRLAPKSGTDSEAFSRGLETLRRKIPGA